MDFFPLQLAVENSTCNPTCEWRRVLKTEAMTLEMTFYLAYSINYTEQDGNNVCGGNYTRYKEEAEIIEGYCC